MNTLWIQ